MFERFEYFLTCALLYECVQHCWVLPGTWCVLLCVSTCWFVNLLVCGRCCSCAGMVVYERIIGLFECFFEFEGVRIFNFFILAQDL